MRHAARSRRLGVKTGHRLAMLRNLSLGLVEHGRIKTTVARAKTLRGFLEPLVTRLKDPSVSNIRLVLSELPNKGAVMEIVKNIAPQFKDRPGGYLRIMKLAKARIGDCADMALVEWSDEALVPVYAAIKDGKKAASSGTKKTAKKAAPKKAVAKKAKKKSE